MTSQVVDLNILGRSLKLNCPVEEIPSLKKAAEDLENRLQELRRKTQIMNSAQLIITAALNISYELTKANQLNNPLSHDYANRLQNLQLMLENTLNSVNLGSDSKKD